MNPLFLIILVIINVVIFVVVAFNTLDNFFEVYVIAIIVEAIIILAVIGFNKNAEKETITETKSIVQMDNGDYYSLSNDKISVVVNEYGEKILEQYDAKNVSFTEGEEPLIIIQEEKYQNDINDFFDVGTKGGKIIIVLPSPETSETEQTTE